MKESKSPRRYTRVLKYFYFFLEQVAGVPWVLAKYARLIGRSILLANLPFEMIDNGDGTFTGASSFTATLDTVVKEIATRALWPLLYSSDALGLPRLHLRYLFPMCLFIVFEGVRYCILG